MLYVAKESLKGKRRRGRERTAHPAKVGFGFGITDLLLRLLPDSSSFLLKTSYQLVSICICISISIYIVIGANGTPPKAATPLLQSRSICKTGGVAAGMVTGFSFGATATSDRVS